MVKIVETDDRVPLSTQLEQDVGAVVVMNKFNVGPDEIKEFLKVYEETTNYFNNLVLSQLNYIEELVAARHSLIM